MSKSEEAVKVKMVKVEDLDNNYAVYRAANIKQLDIIGKIMNNCLSKTYGVKIKNLYFVIDKHGEFKAALEGVNGYLTQISGKSGSDVAKHCQKALAPFIEKTFKKVPRPLYKEGERVRIATRQIPKDVPLHIRQELSKLNNQKNIIEGSYFDYSKEETIYAIHTHCCLEYEPKSKASQLHLNMEADYWLKLPCSCLEKYKKKL